LLTRIHKKIHLHFYEVSTNFYELWKFGQISRNLLEDLKSGNESTNDITPCARPQSGDQLGSPAVKVAQLSHVAQPKADWYEVAAAEDRGGFLAKALQGAVSG
jgi:hypothetical protein